MDRDTFDLGRRTRAMQELRRIGSNTPEGIRKAEERKAAAGSWYDRNISSKGRKFLRDNPLDDVFLELGVSSEQGQHFIDVNKKNTKEGMFKYSKVQDRTMRVGSNLKRKGLGNIAEGISNTASSLMPFALTADEFLSKEFTTRQAIGRSISMINPLNASVRSDMWNMMGFLTKAQKMEEKAGKGMFSHLNRVLTTGLAAMAAFEAIENGDNPITAVASSAVTISGMLGGMAAGRAVGGAIGTGLSRMPHYARSLKSKVKGTTYSGPKKVGAMGKTLRLGGAGVGAVGGAGLAMLLMESTGIDELITKSTESVNYFTEKGAELHHDGQYASRFQSQDTLTMRQKQLAKMSQSGLNDRAMALGYEAMIMRGLM